MHQIRTGKEAAVDAKRGKEIRRNGEREIWRLKKIKEGEVMEKERETLYLDKVIVSCFSRTPVQQDKQVGFSYARLLFLCTTTSQHGDKHLLSFRH